MKKAEVIFIPSLGAGHVFSTVEMAKILLDRDDRLSITVLVMKLPMDQFKSVPSDANSIPRLKFIDLPNDDSVSELFEKSPDQFFVKFLEIQKAHVREIVAGMAASSGSSSSSQIAGFVIDMFCHTMIDVANEFGIPTYAFFTSNASLLGLMFHIQTQADEHHEDFTRYKNSDAELFIPSFANPVPASVMPTGVFDGGAIYDMFLQVPRRLRETKGIIINTFMELEPYAIQSLLQGKNPPIYPVGPVLNLNKNNNNNNDSNSDQYDNIMSWLDSQPSSSVVFLCFGSMGAFGDKQVKEIAYALENSGHRFLWSLRKRPTTGNMRVPIEITHLEEVLPEGFLERTQEIGKVIGWAPQVAVLSHPAVGGFVSHCGWNSTLESVWCGVPMATWPLYAEQQLNAFLLVKDLEMAVDIKMDFRGEFKGEITSTVSVEEIEAGIRQLMMTEGEIGFRKKVKDMKEKSRAAIADGGSSYTALGRLIEDIISNIA